MEPKDQFNNQTDYKFIDISSEEWRKYTFPGADFVIISEPLKLCVEGSGHRLWDSLGVSHYIPSGWIHLEWAVKPGKPNFVR